MEPMAGNGLPNPLRANAPAAGTVAPHWRQPALFRFFEKLLHPYPAAEPALPPHGLLRLSLGLHRGPARHDRWPWRCSRPPCRPSRRCCSPCSAASSTGSASQVPSRLWEERGTTLMWLGGGAASPASRVVALQTIVKHQTLAVNLPMRLRWNFHRLMLGQSMAFYQDEFAGRITTKVMQTALAVRDTHLRAGRRAGRRWASTSSTMIVLAGVLRPRADAALPGLARALHRCAVLLRAAAGQDRQGAGRRALADDRPHHRRLHQHRHRQAVLAHAARGRLRARGDAGVHGHRLRARCGW